MAAGVVEIDVIGASEVEAALSMEACIPLMEAAFVARVEGQAIAPVRTVFHALAGLGDLALMPAQLASPAALGFKAVTIFPGARGHGEPTHQAIVVLLSPDTGRPIAVVDGTAITTIRTAAVSAVATAYMARADAHVLAVLGTGVQAAAHLRSLPKVRAIDEIRVWGRRAQEADDLAAMFVGVAPVVRAVHTAEDAVRSADIIVTATTAREPILDAGWLAAGAHVNAVGACVPHSRELDSWTVRTARVVVDDLDAAMAEAGDLLIPIQEGQFAKESIVGELGDVIIGRIIPRQHPEDVTVFESLGLGFEDVAAAMHVYRAHVAERSPMPSPSGQVIKSSVGLNRSR